MLKKMMEKFAAAVNPGGASSTKIAYLTTGFAGLFAALCLTITFCAVYVWKQIADPAFAGAVASLWLAAYGFVTNAQNKKSEHDKEVAIAQVNCGPVTVTSEAGAPTVTVGVTAPPTTPEGP